MCAPSFLVCARLTTCVPAHSLKGTLFVTDILMTLLMCHFVIPALIYVWTALGYCSVVFVSPCTVRKCRIKIRFPVHCLSSHWHCWCASNCRGKA